MRRRLVALLAVLSTFAVAKVAHADTIATFNVNLALEYGSNDAPFGTAFGQVFLDTTTGQFTGADFLFVPIDPGTVDTFTTVPTFTQSFPAIDEQAIYFTSDQSSLVVLILGLPGTSLAGYNGGFVCGLTNVGCGTVDGFDGELTGPEFSYVYEGTLTFVSSVTQVNPINPFPGGGDGSTTVTPEPSSLALFGTGMACIAGIRRRETA